MPEGCGFTQEIGLDPCDDWVAQGPASESCSTRLSRAWAAFSLWSATAIVMSPLSSSWTRAVTRRVTGRRPLKLTLPNTYKALNKVN